MLAYSIELLFDGGGGAAGELGYLGAGCPVEVEVEHLAVVVAVEAFDEVVELGAQGVGVGVGKVVDDVLVDVDKCGESLFVAEVLGDGVEGYAGDSGVDFALAPELGPLEPKGSDDFLIEVAEVFMVASGIVEACLYDCTFALLEHG